MNRTCWAVIAGLGLGMMSGMEVAGVGPTLPHPIMFVTQTPQPADFVTVTALFGNHTGSVQSAPRGGGLWIRYEDGTVRNLTEAAGYGVGEPRHEQVIAVREPSVHWEENKAVFSMVIGTASRQYEVKTYYWQLYEIRNFGAGETPVITKVPNQPENYNNVSPVYGSDDRIIFTSDRPRDGQRHLYPQLDEYEEAPTVSGLWSLDPGSGDLFMMNHSPSGVFSPVVDSFGRVIFSRWDHLQRDQQADADNEEGGSGVYGTFNYSDETSTALILTNNRAEVFPESRIASGTTNAHTFNHFFPWQINQDGTEEETLNHIGRQELGGSYRSASFNNDPNVRELYFFGNKPNTNTITNFIQPKESPTEAGLFYGIDAPEFGTHAAGQIVALEGAPSINPDLMKLFYITHRETSSATGEGQTPDAEHSGLYRNPLPLSNGQLAAIHTSETREDRNIGTGASPRSRYDFRLKLLKKVGDYWVPDVELTPGFTTELSWWAPDFLITYNGPMWELDPVEVKARPRPEPTKSHIPVPEQQIFAEEGVDPIVFQAYLKQRDLALIVSRNVTGRDKGDQQQPYNLRVPGGVQTMGAGGKVYDVSYMQLFQGDLIRGIGLRNSAPRSGRRVLAQEMHESLADNVPVPTAPRGSVRVAKDGSVAAIVPARRAMTWQLTDPQGEPVVRERYWVTFQPGEIRSCANCHGVNRMDQSGVGPSTNPPEALRDLLRQWKEHNRAVISRVTEGDETRKTITFKRQSAATKLRHRVEYSSDLSTWLEGSSYFGDTVTHSGPLSELTRLPGDHETITLIDLDVNAAERRFYRLRVEKAE